MSSDSSIGNEALVTLNIVLAAEGYKLSFSLRITISQREGYSYSPGTSLIQCLAARVYKARTPYLVWDD